jgi:hypothetical protein
MMSRARSCCAGRQPVNLHQLHGRPDGCERIAQLVREHRQELVLAPIRVLEP